MARVWTLDELVQGVRGGDRRALARAITLVENGDPLAYELVRELYPETGRAYAIGVTGPPGVGKSSLISALVRHVREPRARASASSRSTRRARSRRARCSATASASPTTSSTPSVFIRSMGTRGHLGGLAEATLQAALVLDAAGKDLLFLETVGAGQSEVEVITIADTVVLVLMPGSGDSIQALKAGIMEIPDVIAVNKRDHPAAKTMLNEVRSILALDTGAGVEAADRPDRGDHAARASPSSGRRSREHRRHLEESGRARRAAARPTSPARCSRSRARGRRRGWSRGAEDDRSCGGSSATVQRRELDPLSAVREIMERVFRVPESDGDGDRPDTR